MSYTKALRKKLPTMAQADKECLQFALDAQLQAEKNPMIRSSIIERLRMLNLNLGKTFPGQQYRA